MKLFKALLLSLVLLVGCRETNHPDVPPSSPVIQTVMAQDLDSCSRQPYLAWCSPTFHLSMHDKLVKWDAAARKKFTGVDDKVQYKVTDDWRSHAAEVLAGLPWQDDCDGLAETTIDLLIRDGYPPEYIYRVMVASDLHHKDTVDHFVSVVFDGYKWYVIGDTLEPMYQFKEMQWIPLFYSKVPDGAFWTEVHGTWNPIV